MWTYSRLSCSLLLATLLAACGDESVADSAFVSDGDSEQSSDSGKKVSSSSETSQKKSSSSASKTSEPTDGDSISVDIGEDGLDVVYVLVDGTVSGSVALESFAKSAQVEMVLLDSADSYKRTKTVYTSDIGKDGSYEIKKIDLPQPYVLFSAEGQFQNVADGNTESVALWTLGDASSGELFNLNFLTTLETERTLGLLNSAKMHYEEAKAKAAQDIWKTFHFDASGFDDVERVSVSDGSETATAMLSAGILMQVAADGDFEKFFKALVTDISKNGFWNDSVTRAAVADWALGTDMKEGFASIRKTLEKKMKTVPDFEMYLRTFYQAELGFPACDDESVDKVYFVKNKLSEYYASKYDDVSKSKERFACDEYGHWTAIPDSLKDTKGFLPGKDGEVRQGEFTGTYFVYDAESRSWRVATAVEKDRYFVLNSNAKAFVDIQDVYESVKDDERVIFVLRHAERGDDTSKSGTLTSNGKKQSEEVGARLTKFKDEDFVLGASEFLRAHQTVESIAKGRGQQSEIRDTIPELNDDWYVKNADAVETAKSECGGGWEVTSKYAYTGAYSTGANAAYYNLAERSVELIEDVLLKKYTKERFVLLSSHDKLMVPLVAYCSNLNIELKKYEQGGKWINYLAGVAIIVDKAGNRRYVAIRGLKSGFAD